MSKVQQLFDADLQFCKDCQTEKEKAWMRYTADPSIMGTGGHNPYIEDRKEIEKGIKQTFALKDSTFDWEPKHGFISEDETLGVTTGVYTRTFFKDGEEVELKGKYCTTWKKINGEWKIVLDIGN